MFGKSIYNHSPKQYCVDMSKGTYKNNIRGGGGYSTGARGESGGWDGAVPQGGGGKKGGEREKSHKKRSRTPGAGEFLPRKLERNESSFFCVDKHLASSPSRSLHSRD